MFDGRMGWAEAWALVTILARDRTSWLCAALNGWTTPFSAEATALADLYDLTVMANTDKRKRRGITPYPRPWPVKGSAERSARPTVDQPAIRAALAARGH